MYPHLFPGGSNGKESACNVGDQGSVPGLGRSPGGHCNALQYSCLEISMDRSLAGYSPWGCKESDMTERITHTPLSSPADTLLAQAAILMTRMTAHLGLADVWSFQ